MAYRSDLLFEVFLPLFQRFDRGEIVEQAVPASWNLQPGDRLEYEAGQNISGTTEVVSVGEREGEDVLCTFRKVN